MNKIKTWGSRVVMVLVLAFACSAISAFAFSNATIMDGKPMAVSLLACLLMAPATAAAEKGRKKLLKE